MSSFRRSYIIPNPDHFQPSPAQMAGVEKLSSSAAPTQSRMTFLGRFPTSDEDMNEIRNASPCAK